MDIGWFPAYNWPSENPKDVDESRFPGGLKPISDNSLNTNIWMAYQWNRPESGQGVVVAFRRDQADKSIKLKLFGLAAKANYRLKDLDSGDLGTFTGDNLMSKGLLVSTKNKPDSVVITYSEEK